MPTVENVSTQGPGGPAMTRDDVIRMAKEADIEFQAHAGTLGRLNVTTCGSQPLERIERFAHLVIADFLQRTGQYVTNDASREAALEQAKAQEREVFASPATRRQSIDALVGDRLTAKKADHICERDGYAVTGVVLTLSGGRACIVNRSAVRWLHGDDDLFNLMHTDTAINQRLFDDAVQTEREACAAVRLPVTAFDFRQKILKGELNAKYDEGFLDGVRAMRAAIRTRGQK